jgi:hypothetical protein
LSGFLGIFSAPSAPLRFIPPPAAPSAVYSSPADDLLTLLRDALTIEAVPHM